ncbi:hypothetical protein ACP70R_006007 [Stipagrostis hirtigluma subsp. patula]
MLGAVLRVPAPIPPPLLPAPTRPLLLLRHRTAHCLPPMASSVGGAGAAKPDAAPQPPEKPLPGDCCGSGCVRCVWDVYYDELDAYNKALAAQSSPAPAHSDSGGKPPADSKPDGDGAKS